MLTCVASEIFHDIGNGFLQNQVNIFGAFVGRNKFFAVFHFHVKIVRNIFFD